MLDLTLSHLTISAPPIETIDAAAEAGFGAVGIRLCGRRFQDPYPVEVIGKPQASREIRARLDANGIRLASVNAFQFYPDVGWKELAPVIDTACELSAPVIIANGFDDESRFVDLFARFCASAGDAGIRVALEFLPYSRVRTLQDAVRIVARSGQASAGLLIDALHLDRSGGSTADLRGVSAERIVFAQLCDAMKLRVPLGDGDLMREARSARLELGQGELPLVDFIDALPEGLELEYEVVRADLADRPPIEKARAARIDADNFMRSYRTRTHRNPGGSPN